MAIVEYRCDTCKRTVELPRNEKGLENIGRCVITQGCRGKLYQNRVLEDFQRGSLPDPVAGLEDWIPRKILHDHTQNIKRNEWVIEHNMGVIPTLDVFIDTPTAADPDARTEVQPDEVVIIDVNTVKLVFSVAQSGIAQLIGRQSDPLQLSRQTITEEVTEPDQQITVNRYLMLAVASELNINSVGLFFSASGFSEVVEFPILNTIPNGSAWENTSRLIINGKIYNVGPLFVSDPRMDSGEIPSGSTLKFIDPVTDLPYEANQIKIIYSEAPFERADRVFNKVIDVANVTDTINQFGFFLDNRQLFAKPQTIQSIFPSIRIL